MRLRHRALDETVISDLQLNKRGLEVYVADPQLWVPFEDGTSFSQWMSHEKTLEDLRALGLPSQGDRGLRRLRDLLRRHADPAAQGTARQLGR